jgi:hypothetical protein
MCLSHKSPRGLARNWIQTSVVRGRWLFVWARPSWLLPWGRDWRGDNLRNALLGAVCAVLRSLPLQGPVFCYMTPCGLVCRCHCSAEALRLIFRVVQKVFLVFHLMTSVFSITYRSWYMDVVWVWGISGIKPTEETRYARLNTSQCHFVHYKAHIVGTSTGVGKYGTTVSYACAVY